MTTRQEIISEKIKELQLCDNNYSKIKLLSILYNCKCTDCGGNDNTGACLIEKDYYNNKKRINYVKHTFV